MSQRTNVAVSEIRLVVTYEQVLKNFQNNKIKSGFPERCRSFFLLKKWN